MVNTQCKGAMSYICVMLWDMCFIFPRALLDQVLSIGTGTGKFKLYRDREFYILSLAVGTGIENGFKPVPLMRSGRDHT